jgi:chromosome segregation ATPase
MSKAAEEIAYDMTAGEPFVQLSPFEREWAKNQIAAAIQEDRAERSPGLRDVANGEAGDFTTLCAACDQETDEAHSAKECVAYRDHVSAVDLRIVGARHKEQLDALTAELEQERAADAELRRKLNEAWAGRDSLTAERDADTVERLRLREMNDKLAIKLRDADGVVKELKEVIEGGKAHTRMQTNHIDDLGRLKLDVEKERDTLRGELATALQQCANVAAERDELAEWKLAAMFRAALATDAPGSPERGTGGESFQAMRQCAGCVEEVYAYHSAECEMRSRDAVDNAAKGDE